MKKCKNIVVLCGKFYPNIGAPAGCFYPYIRELAKSNNVVIVSQKTSNLKSEDLIYSIPFYEISNNHNNWKCRLDDAHILGQKSIVNSFSRLFLHLIGGLKTMFLFPDQNKWMIGKYLKVLQNIHTKQNHIDLIISISYPFSAHLAALYYKTKYNSNVRWITYTTDPYAYNETVQYKHTLFKKCKKKWAYSIEKKIFDIADYNIVTDELYNHLLTDFNQSEYKTISFPYLLNRKLQSMISVNSEKPLSAVFAGSLYWDIRNPKTMLNLFKSLPDIYLDLYIRPDLECQKIISDLSSDNIRLHGLVDRTTYENIIVSEADFLINIGNTVSLQSPSKLLELVSTGKPILNFYSVKDAGYRLIERYPLGINIPNSEDYIRYIDSVQKFLCSCAYKRLSFDELSSLFPNNVFENHLEILERII